MQASGEPARGVSVADIGAHTGLAASTVSLALRGAYGVSAETRERVLTAAAELGYDMRRIDRSAGRRGRTADVRRSRAAATAPYPVPVSVPVSMPAALARVALGRAGALGRLAGSAPLAPLAPAVVPANEVGMPDALPDVQAGTARRLRAGVVYPAGTGIAAIGESVDHGGVLEGIQVAAGPMETDLVFLPCLDEDLDPLLRLVAGGAGSGRKGTPDGLILLSLGPRSAALHRALRQPAPVVLLNRFDHSLPCSWVSVHHEHAAGLLARHLLEQGYRVVAYAGDDITPGSRRSQRLAGIREAVRAAQAADPGVACWEYVDRPLDAQLFDELAAAIRAAGEEHPVALLAATDVDLLALRGALRERGLETPRDYGMAAFDDLADTVAGGPTGITSLTYSHEAIGALALRVLRDLREDPLRERQQIFVKVALAVRETSPRRHPR
jgi:DNA-binding LacI/PurR family transcriptional regulator